MPAYFFQRALDMTSSQFDEEMTSMRTLYKTAQGSQTAVQYLRELAEDDDSFNPVQLMQGAGRTKRLMPGRMYMFNYRNPISKSRLPYYDMYPVVLVINTYEEKGYFQGINFHYLPPIYRAELMDQFYRFVINDQATGSNIGSTIRTKVMPRVDFEFMKKRRQFMSFKPAWKRYNMQTVIGQYLYIPPKAWDFVVQLPMGRFRKAGLNRVHMESLKKRRQKLK